VSVIPAVNLNIETTILSGICIPKMVFKRAEKKKKSFFGKFKAKIAIEATKRLKTFGRAATEYKVHPNQISIWKSQVQGNVQELFAVGKKVKGIQKKS